LKGNNEGFPDQNNFYPKRDSQIAKRFAVFGDSFSAAQYIEKNWPDFIEKITHDRNTPIQLLNFSVDGGGLANWWSILTKIVESEHYEIDGVIFAVFSGDLYRTFSISDHQGQTRPMFGRLPSWNPASYPTTLEAARIYLQPLDGNIISTEKFNRLLKGDWTSPSVKNIRFYFAWKIRNIVDNISHHKLSLQKFTEFDKEQKKLIEDIKRSITAINVPALVVHIPKRPELLENMVDKNPLAESRSFADLLGAKYIDGKLAFANNSHDEIKAMWLPYDGHWGQKGSDRFAEFMADILSKWP
jgi:hypothetical protein